MAQEFINGKCIRFIQFNIEESKRFFVLMVYCLVPLAEELFIHARRFPLSTGDCCCCLLLRDVLGDIMEREIPERMLEPTDLASL